MLTDRPPTWEDGKPSPRSIPKESCKHEYITLPNQSQLPELDQRPLRGLIWKAAAVCKRCRLHADVRLDFRQANNAVCPNAKFPLHHFRTHGIDTAGGHLHCNFACTSWGCKAALTIFYRLPYIGDDVLALITDEDLLMRRYRAILEQEPDRKDVTITTPVAALHRLKRYIDDALKPTHDKRQFPAHNKKFLGAFGPECHDFLKLLGFKYSASTTP